jgi:hypothetical protein
LNICNLEKDLIDTLNETTIHTLLTGKYSSSYSYIDMYLYLIDPSSMRAYWYNDDSGGNLQAKIDAYLVSGMTYMVIMSTYSITTQSGFFSLNVT